MGIPFSVNKGAALFFHDDQEKEQWKKAIHSSTWHKRLIKEIKEEAKVLFNEKPVRETYSLFRLFAKTGSRLEYERIYFRKRKRLNTFALLAFLEPDDMRYREELNEAIWAICDEYTWCLPAHVPEKKKTEQVIDLFAAETAMALSEILRISDEAVDPVVRQRVTEEVERRIFIPYRGQSFEWETATHNWAAVCAGSIGAAALHLIKEQDKLEQLLRKVRGTMDCYLDGFAEDGACTEGYGYWQYGFGYFVYFADLLYKKTDGAIDLLQSEKVHQIALFQQKCFLHENRIANFSDSLPETSVFLGLSHYLNGRFPDVHIPDEQLGAHFTDDHCSRWAPAFRNLLWVKQNRGKPWPDNSYFLKDAQWFVSRHKSYAFAAKGGHNGEPHNHNDVGHFILSDADSVYFQDIGSGLYSKDYFGEGRYSFLCNGSQGHSVPVINGFLQEEGRDRSAQVERVVLDRQTEQLQIDLVKAYKDPTLQHLKRSFIWKKHDKPALILKDSYCFSKKPESIVERLVSPVLTIDKSENGFVLGGKLFVQFDHNQLKFTKEITEYSNHFGEVKQVMLLHFDLIIPKEACEIEIQFKFL
ncbi:heparinase II/III family protein [Domibacillus robiginosus]|uniref:heparinase II/III family protein n=1 Tax=Domibacillus robiginosus TaxID=1071054 RepID=UPI00067D7A87|nr:heparinase II/III family protein [Domibacillus robiginosus]